MTNAAMTEQNPQPPRFTAATDELIDAWYKDLAEDCPITWMEVQCGDIQSLIARIEADREEKANLRALNAEMLEALTLVEWGDSDESGRGHCPDCGYRQNRNGHNPRCRIAAIIAKAEKGTNG